MRGLSSSFLSMLCVALAGAPAAGQSVAYIGQVDEVRATVQRTGPSRPAPAPRGNSATIVQHGDANTTALLQQGEANVAFLSQQGNGNAIRTRQEGYAGGGNIMNVTQSGDRNTATLGQTGSDNRLDLTQAGTKDATITQNGNSTVNVAQLGHGPDSISVNTDPGASVSVTRYSGMAQGGR